jgi:ParB-like chromosome segregation protein Spo0J
MNIAAPLTMDVEPSFEPALLLAELKAKTRETPPHPLPDRLPLSAIKQIPELFQSRRMSERHISELVRAIQNFGVVEPVTVIQVGNEPVLIDGHHRLAAYALAKRTTDIPVRYFPGTLEEAILEAGAANSKAKLSMTTQERQDYAWRLELFGRYSKAEIAAAAGVSKSQVAYMRAAKRTIGDEAFSCRSWSQARRLAAGKNAYTGMDEEEREQWIEEQANKYADRLTKEFGNKLSNNPEVAAMALAIYFGRRLPEIHAELGQHLAEEDDCDDDF